MFLLDQNVPDQLNLEKALVHRVIKARNLERWSIEWRNLALFYPYRKQAKNDVPALTIGMTDLGDKKLAKRLTGIGLEDASYLDIQYR